MNRVIKFRYVYSNGTHVFTKIHTLEQIECGYVIEELSDNPLLRGHKVISKDQFTGLLDKDGKDIYENSIIRDTLTQMVYIIKHGFCKKHAFTGWYVENGEGSQYLINNDSDSDRNSFIQVIGNIYDNPDLIK